VGSGQDALQGSVLGQHGRRGLLADPGHTGQAVGRVAAQQGQLGVRVTGAVRGNAVALGHFGRAEQRRFLQPLADIEHPHLDRVVGNQLQQVPVAADDDDRVVAFGVGQGAEDVVGLEALGAGGGDTERAENLQDHVHLGAEIVGDLLGIALVRADGAALLGHPVRLVRGNQVDPELRTPVQIKAHHQARGPVLSDQGGDAVEESAYRIDGSAIRGRDRRRHPEVGPEPHAGAVEQ